MAESFLCQMLRQVPPKEGREILCDPGWCVHQQSNVQNKRDDNIHTHIPVFEYIV